MRPRYPFGGQQGFTLVELMVAALVLVVGMLATVSVLQTAHRKTSTNTQRVAASNLARELTETARQIAYDVDLTPARLRPRIQASASDLGSGSPWQVKRRNTTFSVAASVCTYDDPADGLATVAPDNRCTDNPTTSTQPAEQNGDDFRRVTFSVSWRADGGRAETFTQSSLIVNPSGGLGPRILSFTGPANTITSGNFAHFDLTTTWAATVHWNADDGVSNGDALPTGGTSHTSWYIDWDLGTAGAAGAVLDGTYVLTAQAFDDFIAGDAKVATVTINRQAPGAVTTFEGGHDTRVASNPWVDLQWSLSPERDVVGYRVYWAGADNTPGTADDRLACPTAASGASQLSNETTSCRDVNPPSGAAIYYVQALDQTTPPGASPRPGAIKKLDIPAPTTRPSRPLNLAITGIDKPEITWAVPAAGQVAFYRIYRDGTNPDQHRIGAVVERRYVDHGATGAHTYYITAVNPNFNESDPASISWNP